jgi:hypothetical protein
MTQPSTISMERLTDQIHKITFSNPPTNLIVPETVSGLHDAVKEMSEDTRVQVAIFASSTPDYFFNYFDLSQASDFPATPDGDSTPAWVDLVLRLSKAPFISIASTADGQGAAGTNSPLPAICARPAASWQYSVNLKSLPASSPAAGAANAYLDSSGGIGHSKPS